MPGTAKVILGKKEVTYGLDPTPVPATNAFLTRNFKVTPLAVDQLERNLDLPSRGRKPTAPTNKRSKRTFELEIAGSGTAGTAAAWMEVLEGCGMLAPVLVATTSATQRFAPSGSDGTSLTFYDWHANLKRIGGGSRGTFGWNFTAGAYPFWTLDFTSMVALTGGVATSTPGVPDFTRFQKPLEVNVDNTDISLGGYVLSCQSFTGDVNAEVALRNLTAERYIRRGDHAITGTLRAKCPDLTSKNYWLSLDSGDALVFDLVHGTVAGNIVEMSSTNFQVISVEVSEDSDQLMLDIGYGLNVSAGQDDLIIISR